jgi:hypothetical protein
MKSMTTGRLSDDERDGLDRDGYVVHPCVFAPTEIAEIVSECEALVADLVRDRHARRFPVGSYVFDPDYLRDTMIKWEGDTDVVHGIEPFAHLSPALDAWAHDSRFLEPMCDLVGDDRPALFTEKLNLKRPRHGGVNPLHQTIPTVDIVPILRESRPRCCSSTTRPSRTDACTSPGSHGVWKGRIDGDRFAANDRHERLRGVEAAPLELRAGSVVMFGLHPSTARTESSERERYACCSATSPPVLRTCSSRSASSAAAADRRRARGSEAATSLRAGGRRRARTGERSARRG